MSTPLRRAVEHRSGPLLAWLATRPPWVPLVAMLALVLGGLFAPPGALGAALLALLLLVLGWLTFLRWPQLAPGGRLVRLAVLALVVVALVQRATGS